MVFTTLTLLKLPRPRKMRQLKLKPIIVIPFAIIFFKFIRYHPDAIAV